MEEINHFSHKEHPLKLVKLEIIIGASFDGSTRGGGDEKRGVIGCYACKKPISSSFAYGCIRCGHFMHKACTELPPTINQPSLYEHPLTLLDCGTAIFQILDIAQKAEADAIKEEARIKVEHEGHPQHTLTLQLPLTAFPCDACNTKDEGMDGGIDDDDNKDLLHFPMLEAFTDPLKLLHTENIGKNDDENSNINHWSHHHPLILITEAHNNMSGSSDEIEKRCPGCYCSGNRFLYRCETCNFNLDVNCAFLPNTIKHKSHKHPLIQVIDPDPDLVPLCNACNRNYHGINYACSKDCNFILDMYCAVRWPSSLAHRYCKGHEIPLTYPPVTDHPEDFFCEICETEMHPKMSG
ncbi:hypothetical protein L2E82_47955 [Cichorium intybus]|uniref:Uncharacterized protein n=1 Tax=Cichorium intybus TaxID=13427 RepID=A0ACB8YXG2_CICIN|nr:hypothetical protein L2E82_47955 [Cichorium intybus]